MSKQDIKYKIGLAGEFLVAGELLRRGIHAAVTYGNAKKADVVAINGNKALSLEVKTTSQHKWAIGSKFPEPTELLWIFVYLPGIDTDTPEYFILSGKELYNLLIALDTEWLRLHPDFQGLKGPGFLSLRKDEISTHKGAWHKVKAALGIECLSEIIPSIESEQGQ